MYSNQGQMMFPQGNGFWGGAQQGQGGGMNALANWPGGYWQGQGQAGNQAQNGFDWQGMGQKMPRNFLNALRPDGQSGGHGGFDNGWMQQIMNSARSGDWQGMSSNIASRFPGFNMQPRQDAQPQPFSGKLFAAGLRM